MTATRIGRGATLVALAAAWIVGAVLLWRTSVPHLHLHADAHRWFTSAQIEHARRYERLLYVLWVLHLAATIAALIVLTRRAPALARSIGIGRVGKGVIVSMVVLVTLWAVGLPFGLAAQWWDARHGLAPHDYVSWLLAPWATLVAEALFVLATVVIVMGLAGALGRRWWIVGAPTFVAIAAAFAFLDGYVEAVGTHPLHRAELHASLLALERKEHVEGTPIGVDDVSSYTKEANAFSVGFGQSTHVVLWNTLLDGRFAPPEIRFVVAHELGHVHHRHVLKALAWFALLALPLAWFVTWVTRSRGGLAEAASLPQAFLALVIVTTLAAPFQNAVSRRYEAEADWSALLATNDPRAGAGLFRAFERTSLQDPSPPGLAYLWFADHPTLAQRLAMTVAYRARAR
jgi:STE24 endopeptidase